MNDENVLVMERPHPQISVLRLNRPNRRNALNEDLLQALHQTLATIAEDPSQRVVILTGSGTAFCAGMDVTSARMREPAQLLPAARLARQQLFAGVAKRIRALPQPVIAAINGPAAGAGLGMALAADIRIASHEAQFMVAAIRIGVTAGECGISYNLPRLIGASRAFEVMLTGRPIDASEAEKIGLISKVISADSLMNASMDMAHAILENSPFGVTETKKLMWTNLNASSFDAALDLENRAQIVAAYTEDFAEATLAFSEKRKAHFKGR